MAKVEITIEECEGTEETRMYRKHEDTRAEFVLSTNWRNTKKLVDLLGELGADVEVRRFK